MKLILLVLCGLFVTISGVGAIPNPAAVHCEKQGGVHRADGKCRWQDGKECDAWAFFRGEVPDCEVNGRVSGLGMVDNVPHEASNWARGAARDVSNWVSNVRREYNFARRDFPVHWGAPPRIETRDHVPLGYGFGFGSSTLRSWIYENELKDKMRHVRSLAVRNNFGRRNEDERRGTGSSGRDYGWNGRGPEDGRGPFAGGACDRFRDPLERRRCLGRRGWGRGRGRRGWGWEEQPCHYTGERRRMCLRRRLLRRMRREYRGARGRLPYSTLAVVRRPACDRLYGHRRRACRRRFRGIRYMVPW